MESSERVAHNHGLCVTRYHNIYGLFRSHFPGNRIFPDCERWSNTVSSSKIWAKQPFFQLDNWKGGSLIPPLLSNVSKNNFRAPFLLVSNELAWRLDPEAFKKGYSVIHSLIKNSCGN